MLTKETCFAMGSKQDVLRMIKRLPEKTSIEDIMYELYVRQRVDRGLHELATGKTISHASVKRSVAKWLQSAGR
jgi:hypothetical protein